MYLSQCLFERKLAVNPYEQHRLLWQHFPNDPAGSRPFLFRLEEDGRNTFRKALMLSSREPVSAPQGSCLLASKPFDPVLRCGQHLWFLLEANPIKRLIESRKRVPLIDEEEQISWLVNKLEPSAQLHVAQVTARQNLFFRKKTERGKPSGSVLKEEWR